MQRVRELHRKFQSSDGRIKLATLSGVSALVAVIALLVGVLPVMAIHQGQDTTSGSGVHPELIRYGGGPGACAFVGSAASFELHINNPTSGQFTDPATGVTVNITVNNRKFTFDFGESGAEAYDVVVNGGPQNLHYDYDAVGAPVISDSGLQAPAKANGDLNNLSHINLCYDVAPINFVCGVEVEAVLFGDPGDFTKATAEIIEAGDDCEKLGFFFIRDGEVTLDFGTGTGIVAGRAEFEKQFDTPDDFEALQYDGGPTADFEDVPWCSTGGDQHPDFPEIAESPGLPDGHTACKVYEEEDATGFQYTVVYFEFEDPNFR